MPPTYSSSLSIMGIWLAWSPCRHTVERSFSALWHSAFQWLHEIFKSEVPEHGILHGSPDTVQAGPHRFKLVFTQMPHVLLLLCLFLFTSLLRELCYLLWHRYLLTVVFDHDIVVHLCLFYSQRRDTHLLCRDSAKNCRPSWKFPVYRSGGALRGPGMSEATHRCEPHQVAVRLGFRLTVR